MSLITVPLYNPRAASNDEVEKLRVQLAKAEKTIAAQKSDIRDLIHNGNLICDSLKQYCLRIRDYKAIQYLEEMRATFHTFTPKE